MKKLMMKIVSVMLSVILSVSLLVTAELPSQAASKVQLVKKSASVAIGKTTSIKIKNAPKKAKISYKSNKTAIATVTQKGKVTGVKAGSTKIIVTVDAGGRKTRLTYKIKVMKPSFSKRTISVPVGRTRLLSLKDKPKNAKLSWSTSRKGIATVDKKGRITGKSQGSATITARVKANKKTYKLSCRVVVKEEAVTDGTEKSKYTVAFDSKGGSVVASQTVEAGGKAVQPANPTREGYTFAGWYRDAEGKVRYDFSSAVTSNLTLYAKWEAVPVGTFTVVFDSKGGSAVASQTVKAKGKAAQPANPTKEGYTFAGWYRDVEGKVRYDFSNAVTSNLTLYAKWEPIAINVRFDSAGGSEVPPQQIAYGTKVTEPEAPTKEGYQFGGWYTQADGGGEVWDFGADTVTSELTLYAKWDEEDAVTREEWIVSLSELLDLPEVADSQHSIDDYADAEEPAKIEAAVRKGFVPLSPDGDNMIEFKPTEPVTREFVAYTAVHALEYQVDGEATPDWEDAGDLTYPAEALLAVNMDILQMRGNRFLPDGVIISREMDSSLGAVQEILDRTGSIGEEHGETEYVDGVQETQLTFEEDEENGKIHISEPSKIAGWEVGEVHVLKSEDSSQNDIAVKVSRIYEEGGETILVYEEPKLEEVVTSFDVAGSEASEGVFIPEEDVVVDGMMGAKGATSGEVPLFGKKNIALNIGDGSLSGSIDFRNLEYRFVASPSWHLVTIDEAYLALNTSLEINASYMNELDQDIKKKIGTVKVPLGYGFNAAGDVYLVFKAEGGVEVSFEVTQKTGIQYTQNGGIRPIYDMDVLPGQFALKAEVRGGVALDVGAEFLGIDIVTVGAEAGLAAEGSVENISAVPVQFCLDAGMYLYLGLYAQIGWDDLNLRYEHEVLNSDNSIWKRDMHFEETGFVEECTRGSGDYEGHVQRADNGTPIHGAKVQILKDGRIKDTTYTDSNGYFKGIRLRKDSYQVRISASGYRPYEQTFQIIGGQTTTLQTQLMISNEEEEEGRRLNCSGTITDAYTGGTVSGATIVVHSQSLFGDDELVAETTSGADGSFMFEAPIGNYRVTVQKEGYVENTRSIVLSENMEELQISLSPENQPSVEGNLRVVLRWGETPSDLDSHMVGPAENGSFHVYYANKVEDKADLDVDDVTSYGPETVSVREMVNGTYSYYVHDYTNRGSRSSTRLSNSGAYIQVYSANSLLYTINIPTNRGGTLWHVFDYDSETNQIQLINEFSYQSSPSSVGNTGSMGESDVEDVLKDYEIEALKQKEMDGTN